MLYNYVPQAKVIVKENIFCPDYPSLSISNWEGTIERIIKFNTEIFFLIKWNTNTINTMPQDYLIDSNKKNLDYKYMYLKSNKLITTI